MDKFDTDFEFKPITEGLGFHRKAKAIRDDIENSSLAREELTIQIPKAEKPLEKPKQKTMVDLVAAMGANSEFLDEIEIGTETPKPAPKSPVKPLIKPKLSEQLQKSMAKATGSEPHLCPITFSFSAMLFDAIMAFALALLFLIALVVATETDINRLLQATTMYTANQIGMLVLYISVAQLYLIITRGFAGQTLGEWAFDIQLGTREDQEQPIFPLLVFARSILITLTGVIILPIISAIFGIDYAAKLLSLKLYRAE